jgi:ribosomal protein S14
LSLPTETFLKKVNHDHTSQHEQNKKFTLPQEPVTLVDFCAASGPKISIIRRPLAVCRVKNRLIGDFFGVLRAKRNKLLVLK